MTEFSARFAAMTLNATAKIYHSLAAKKETRDCVNDKRLRFVSGVVMQWNNISQIVSINFKIIFADFIGSF